MSELCSRFGKNIDTSNPLPLHPNPYFQRDNFVSLNGVWQFAITKSKEVPSVFGSIIVPFAVETKLSGVHCRITKDDFLHYRKEVEFKEDEIGKTILLHFEAVDQVCDVFVDGKHECHHEGGYFRFEFPLKIEQRKIIIDVVVSDDTESEIFARGKQSNKPSGIFYTPTSGIWGSVWYEFIPDHKRIISLKTTSLFDDKSIKIEIEFSEDDVDAEAIVKYKGKIVSESKISGKTAVISLENAFYPWSPDQPNLYEIAIKTKSDTIHSVFTMRKWSLIKFEGKQYVGLNGKPIFLNGLLDQGYFPESGLTFPSEEAIIEDIKFTKRCGFNCLRKHIKIESMRWYYQCDLQGVVVCQDMVSGGDEYSIILMATRPILSYEIDDTTYEHLGRKNKASRDNFEQEMSDTIKQLYNVNSIGIWTLFNEGWGQFDAVEMSKKLSSLDETRLIDSTSGWYDKGCGSFQSRHIYFKKLKMKNDGKRILSLSEFGGYALYIKDHSWSTKQFGYKKIKSKEELTASIKNLYLDEVKPHIVSQGLSMCIYTQLSDVESEVNGLITYDREVEKIDAGALKAMNDEIYAAFARNFIKNNIKIAFFDIDWTIYDHINKRFSPISLEAIKKLEDKGVKIILCTARPYHSIKDLGTYDLGIEWDGYIASAGAIVKVGDKYLKKDLMDKDITSEMIEMAKNDGNCMEAVTPTDRMLIGKQNECSKNFYNYFFENVPESKEYEGEECTGLNLFCEEKFDKKYKDSFPNLVFFRYCDFAIDVMPFERTKGEGVQRILEHYGFQKNESIGFGDDYQDIPLAENVGFFVSMGQGRKELKDIASYVTEPVWADGVSIALETINLI